MVDIETSGDWHWRNSMRPVRFFFVDARAAAAFMLFLLHMRLWTFLIAFFVISTLWAVERMGYTFSDAIRGFRAWMVGRRRPAYLWLRNRGMVDYGR